MIPKEQLNQLEQAHWENREAILITSQAKKALIDFLIEDVEGTGEGYSQFILKAVALRKKEIEKQMEVIE